MTDADTDRRLEPAPQGEWILEPTATSRGLVAKRSAHFVDLDSTVFEARGYRFQRAVCGREVEVSAILLPDRGDRYFKYCSWCFRKGAPLPEMSVPGTDANRRVTARLFGAKT